MVYAVPEPDDELVVCMRALHARFPDTPPYGGEFDEVIPHATVAETAADEEEVRRRLAPHLPMHFHLDAATLLEEFEPDRWREREELPLLG